MSATDRPAVDAAVVARVAWLARVHLQPDEAVRLEHDLEQILGYVAQLRELDTTGVEPMVHPARPDGELATPLRPDVAAPGLGSAAAVANAPQAEAGSFVVPRVVGGA